MAYFFVGYRIVGLFPHLHSIKPEIILDSLIPLVPFFIIFYVFGYIFVFIPTLLINERREFYSLAKTYFLIISLSFLVFLAVPIELQRNYATENNLLSRVTLFQQRVDTRFNNFPSLHVALNLFSFLVIKNKNSKLGKSLLPLIILIIASTLFVKPSPSVSVVFGSR